MPSSRRHRLAVAATLLGLVAGAGPAHAQLPPNFGGCTAEALTQSTSVAPNGDFTIRNVPADTDALFSALITCPLPTGGVVRGTSPLFRITMDQTVSVPSLVFRQESPVPLGLAIAPASGTLTDAGARQCVTVSATMPDGSQRNLTYPRTGTTYRTSNAAVATVDRSGCLVAKSRGIVILSAQNASRTATARFQVRGVFGADTDGDGMDDACETSRGLDPRSPYDAADDPDGDGLANLEECASGTDPFADDTDGDGLDDPDELTAGTDPTNPDSDGDELLDGAEIARGADPLDPNTDDDCLEDGLEVRAGLDPTNPNDTIGDRDGDGLSNCDEGRRGTAVGNPDSDGDGIGDGEEVSAGADGFVTDPLDDDTDVDGLNDGTEVQLSLNPITPNTPPVNATVSGRTATIRGRVQLGSLQLLNGAVLTHPAATTSDVPSLELVLGSLTIDATSRIDVTGRGFLGALQGGNNVATGRTLGNVAGSALRTGGSHGGPGGRGDFGFSTNPAYDDFRNPAAPGSGGGGDCSPGGNGGGLVRIAASSVTLNGQIVADGQDGQGTCGAGGAGGGIRLITTTLAGVGSIRADGGPGDDQLDNGGGGGGGRVAVLYGNAGGFNLANVRALGGNGDGRGGPGTVFLQHTGVQGAGELRIGAGGNAGDQNTPLYALRGRTSTSLMPNVLTDGAAAFVPGTLVGLELNPDTTQNRTFTIVANDATTLFTDPADGSMTVVAVTGNTYRARTTLDRLTVTASAVTELLDGDGTQSDRRARLDTTDLVLTSGGILTHPLATVSARFGLELVAAGTVTIDATSAIDVRAKGFLGGNQAGNGNSGRTLGNVAGSGARSGGSHGGLGGLGDIALATNLQYGDVRNPDHPGAGGGADCQAAGNGGGLLRLTAATLAVAGQISADGQDGLGTCGGGGAGGSINLDVGTVNGAGTIHADGGPGDDQLDNGGGGGGGRIAVRYDTPGTFDLATLSVVGGPGVGPVGSGTGGTGTVFTQRTGARGVLVVDGGGRETPLPDGYQTDDLRLDGARVSATSIGAEVVQLINGSVLTHPGATPSTEPGLELDVGTLTIDATSRIDVSARGYLGGNQGGNGNSGRTLDNAAGSGRRSGGSHGGLGGLGDADRVTNPVYGDFRNPRAPGAGGGADCGAGGDGGGLLRLSADTLTVDGQIAADGQDGLGTCGGGGAGGGVRMVVGTLAGSGTIHADGGPGDDQLDNGGGGGGGRIAIEYGNASGFDLETQVRTLGGAGVGRGSPGTVFTRHQGVEAAGVLRIGSGALVPSRVTPLYSLQAGTSTGLQANALTDAAAVFVPGTLIGLELVPDLAQAKSFTVIANDATTLLTDPADGDMTAVASVGAAYGAQPVLDRVELVDAAVVEVVDGNTVLADRRGLLTTTDLALTGESRLTHPPATPTSRFGLDLTVASTVTIDATSAIDLRAKGFLGGNQGGNGNSGRTLDNVAGSGRRSGGSHGGLGGLGDFDRSTNPAYGDFRNPSSPGAGGGADCQAAGNGGGLLRLTADTLTVDGQIDADGQDGLGTCGGGGAGGAIRMVVETLAGDGDIHADGGLGDDQLDNGGGGGGGRIAIEYGDASGFDLEAQVRTLGGMGLGNGSPGTVFTRQAGVEDAGVLRIGAGGLVPSRVTPLYSLQSGTSTALEANALSDAAAVFAPGTLIGLELVPDLTQDESFTVIANDATTLFTDPADGDMTAVASVGSDYGAQPVLDRVEIVDAAVVEVVDGNTALADQRGFLTATDLTLAEASRLTHPVASLTARFGLDLTVPGAVTIDATSAIDVRAKGFLGGNQGGNGNSGRTLGNVPGSGRRGGGSHGGLGGLGDFDQAVNGVYGDPRDPDDPGAGGGADCGAAGNGGGLLRVTAGTLAVAGQITADGQDGLGTCGGGGAGGTINLDVGTLNGAGTIHADGGPGDDQLDNGGGGGGGRIAVRYATLGTFDLATLSVLGGVGAGPPGQGTGGIGTVFVVSPGARGLLTIRGAGRETPLPAGYDTDDLLLDGARVSATSASPHTLRLVNGSVLTHPGATTSTESALELDVETLEIDATSSIDVSARGYLGGRQAGNGNSGRALGNVPGSGSRGGGSHGGLGGFGTVGGGTNTAYGDFRNPSAPGAGGGADCGAAGNGGGLLRLTADTLTLEGQIAADGQDGLGTCGGGGAGGGVRMVVGILAGDGSIHADGGPGDDQLDDGGGGGGGRIAIEYDDASGFDLEMQVRSLGGPGSGRGSPGTVFTRQAGVELAGVLRIGAGTLATSRVTPLYSLQGGTSTALSANALTDATAVFLPGTLIGLELAPDVTHSARFTVIGNDATTLFTDPADGSMTAAASVGAEYGAQPVLDRVEIVEAAAVEVVEGNTVLGDQRGLLATTDLELRDVGVLTHPVATLTKRFGLELTAAGTVAIDATSAIDVRAKGFLGGRQDGNGNGGRTIGNVPGGGTRSGGSHGGLGGVGDQGGVVAAYGDPRDPDGPGGGGGADCQAAGNGGGLVRLAASTLAVDGQITADGQDGLGTCGGGGAGGGIRVDVDTLAGVGTIHANGGPGDDQLDNSGAGGGGRVAVYYATLDGFDLGMGLSASGGNGRDNGGAGTVFTRETDAQLLGVLDVDNAGRTVPNGSTPLRAIGAGTSTALAATQLTDTGRSFPLPDPESGVLGLVGLLLRPNVGSPDIFTVVDNTATALVTDPADGAMTSVAAVGNSYIGVYLFDAVTVTNGARVVTTDRIESSAAPVVDGTSRLQAANLTLP